MHASVEDVGERQRKQVRLRSAEVPIERHPGRLRGCVRRGERNAEDGIGSQPRLVGGAVELDQGGVDRRLVGDVCADELWRDLVENVPDRLLHPLATVASGVSVPELQRLVLTGRRAGGHDCRAASGLGVGGDGDGRVAAGVENLEGAQSGELNHPRGKSSRGRMLKP